jgi:uncharacterized membrane protein YphA (DoxX/SURF4 family)
VDVALWIAQIILAALFVTAGITKLTQPADKLAKSLPWTRDFSPAAVRFIGVAEFLGAVGLVLPALTRIAPALVPVAACGLAVVMVLASAYHFRKKELSAIGFTGALFALAAFVAWGRFGPWAL